MSQGQSHIVDLREIPAWSKKTTVEPVEGDIPGFRCDGCGHVWRNRTEEPSSCPDCGAGIVWDEDELNAPEMLTEADFSELHQPSVCAECGEEIEAAEAENRPASDEDSLTLADVLDSGDENNGA